MERARRLTGKKVYLSPLEETDIRQIQIWMNNPRLIKNLNTYLPLTLKDEQEWYDRISKRNDANIILAIVKKESDELIGIMGLHNIHPIHKTATTGSFIGDLENQGKGYGSDAKMLLLHYAFKTLQLRRVNSSAKSFNKQSINYSLKCGYIKEYVRKEQFVHGDELVGEVLLSATVTSWEPKWNIYYKGYEDIIIV